jgi:carbonic anhydrase
LKKLRTFLPLAVALFAAPAATHAQWKTPWSYEGANGPEHWGALDPAYSACKSGKEQSPIDIRQAQRVNLPPLKFEYRSGPLKIINNGYTAVRVNYVQGNGNFLTVVGSRYELTQFHFHRPSEEYVDGKPYDMVAHFMHEDASGKVLGVAVFLKAGSANATIQRLWQHMPNTPGKEQEVAGVEVNPADLLPRNSAYYMYMGSLTAPPCTEGVTWIVLKMPVEISPGQIAAFAKLYPHDVRPLQPLNGRIVKESQ